MIDYKKRLKKCKETVSTLKQMGFFPIPIKDFNVDFNWIGLEDWDNEMMLAIDHDVLIKWIEKKTIDMEPSDKLLLKSLLLDAKFKFPFSKIIK